MAENKNFRIQNGIQLPTVPTSGTSNQFLVRNETTGNVEQRDVTTINHFDEIFMNTGYTGGTYTEGRLTWNPDDNTLNIDTGVNQTTLQVNQEQVVKVVNKTGSDISDGLCVYINGAQGNRPTITLASNDTEASSSKVLGVTTNAIPNNEEGYVTVNGIVRGFDTHTFTDGDVLWLETNGRVTATKPVAPLHSVFIGYALNSTNNGSIYVNPINGFELEELHNVLITTPLTGDTLKYNGSLWVNSNDASVTKDFTGFVSTDSNLKDINIIYNQTTRKITLDGTFKMYYQGNLILDVSASTWTSDAHSTGVTTTQYLSYDGTSFVWSSTIWKFWYAQVASVSYNTNGSFMFAGRETHGLMDWECHEHFHDNIGTVVASGGDIGGGIIINSNTATARRPLIGATVLSDEDLYTSLPAQTTNSYTIMNLSGASGTSVFVTGATEFVKLLSNNPYYNYWDGANWVQTLVANNAYMCMWCIAIPVTSDAASQLYRYVWIQGQQSTSLLATQQGLVSSSINTGNLSSIANEFVFIAKAIVRFTGGNWVISQMDKLRGNKLQQTSVPAGNYLSAVNTDTTLVNDGTVALPLGVNPNLSITTLSASTSVTTPVIKPFVDSTSGLTITKANGTTAIVTVDTTNSRVGIGTIGATSTLHLNNTGADNNYIKITNADTGAAVGDGLDIGITSTEKSIIWNYENTDLALATNNVERLTIKNDGNVGIGTTTPTVNSSVFAAKTFNVSSLAADTRTAIEICGNKTSDDLVGALIFTNNSSSALDASTLKRIAQIGAVRDGNNNAGKLSFATVNDLGVLTSKMSINKDGKVGIGTSAPAHLLHIYSNDALNTPNFTIEQDGTGDASMKYLLSGEYAWMSGVDNSDGNKFKIADTGTDLSTNTRLTIVPTTGFVGIGTDAPYSKLNVNDINATGYASLTISNTTPYAIGSVSASTRLNFSHPSTTITEPTIQAYVEGWNENYANSLNGYLSFGTRTSNVLTEKMRINTIGFVGIGTTAPTGKLHVVDAIGSMLYTPTGNYETLTITNTLATGSTGSALVTTVNNTAKNHYSGIYNDLETATLFGKVRANMSFVGTDAEALLLGTLSNKPIYIGTNNLTRLTIGADGKVGIGTDAPTGKLHINEPSAANAYLKFTNTDTGTAVGDGLDIGITTTEKAVIWNYENTAMGFATNNVERLFITADGKVGIGAAPVSELFEVSGTSLFKQQVTVGTTSSASIQMVRAGANYISCTDASGSFIVRTGGYTNNRLTIAADGLITNSTANYSLPTTSGVTGEILMRDATNTTVWSSDYATGTNLTRLQDQVDGIDLVVQEHTETLNTLDGRVTDLEGIVDEHTALLNTITTSHIIFTSVDTDNLGTEVTLYECNIPSGSTTSFQGLIQSRGLSATTTQNVQAGIITGMFTRENNGDVYAVSCNTAGIANNCNSDIVFSVDNTLKKFYIKVSNIGGDCSGARFSGYMDLTQVIE